MLACCYDRTETEAKPSPTSYHFANAVVRSAAVWEELRIHKDQEQVLLAGHEPLFSTLTAFLLGCGNLQVDFKKGALVSIDVDRFGAAPGGVLKWMLTPKVAGGG